MSTVDGSDTEQAEITECYCNYTHIVPGPCDSPAISLSYMENNNAQPFAVTSFALCKTRNRLSTNSESCSPQCRVTDSLASTYTPNARESKPSNAFRPKV